MLNLILISKEFIEQFVKMVAYGNDGLGNKSQFGKDISGAFGTMFYGSDLENGTWRGAYFRINAENTIDIRRLADDPVWEEVRVYIWVIP